MEILSGRSQTINVLKASHIKPWKISSDNERLDVFNGLLLTPNIDALFDKGFITFDKTGALMISRKLENVDAKLLLPEKLPLIRLHKNHETFLKYHREIIFKK